MQNFKHQIYKYRLLWAASWLALTFSIVYSVYASEWILLLASFVWARIISVLGIQIGLHRYFSHRSFETGPNRRRFLLWFSILGGEGSPIAWSTHHRHHHRYHDTEKDLHSPHKPFGSVLLSAFTWQIQPVKYWLEQRQVKTMTRDLIRDSEVKFVDRHYYNIWLFLAAVSLVIDWRLCLYFVLAPAGWALVAAVFVNTLSHLKLPGSYQTYPDAGITYNNKWIHWLIFGEGLHNNHHHDGGKYNQAFNKGEFDLTGWIVAKFFVK